MLGQKGEKKRERERRGEGGKRGRLVEKDVLS